MKTIGDTLSEQELTILARCLRLGMITGVYRAGGLDKESAQELLRGTLTPDEGDPVDDSNLLELDYEIACRKIREDVMKK